MSWGGTLMLLFTTERLRCYMVRPYCHNLMFVLATISSCHTFMHVLYDILWLHVGHLMLVISTHGYTVWWSLNFRIIDRDCLSAFAKHLG